MTTKATLPLKFTLIIIFSMVAFGCKKQTSVSEKAIELAQQSMYKSVEYENKDKAGPAVLVISGEIKSNNIDFVSQIAQNNIQDFAELELSKANFQVLERTALGSMMTEIELAANLGDAEGLKKFKKGKFKTTNWLIKFDILKAEPVAAVGKKHDSKATGELVGAILSATTKNKKASQDIGRIIGSSRSSQSSHVWVVGMRYKVLDANTGEQKYTNYFEDILEINQKSSGFMGSSSSQSTMVTLDTLVQRLVQKCVVQLDASK